METLITVILIYITIAILTLIVLLLNLGTMGREEGDTAVAIGMAILFPITYIILIYEWIRDSIQINRRIKQQNPYYFEQNEFKVEKRGNRIFIDLPDQKYVINTLTGEIHKRKF